MKILGTDYRIEVNDDIRENGDDGVCHTYSKLIEIVNACNMLDRQDSADVKQIRFNEVMRHEILHAFFHESGHEEWCADETLVTFLALQFPKLVELFIEQDCMK